MPLGSKLYINDSGENITSTTNGDLELNSRTELRLKANTNSPSTFASLEFYTSNSERMRITTTGGVGIGTTSPSHKLTVEGTTSPTTARVKTTTGNANLRVSTNNSDFAIIGQGGSNRLDIYDNNGSDVENQLQILLMQHLLAHLLSPGLLQLLLQHKVQTQHKLLQLHL